VYAGIDRSAVRPNPELRDTLAAISALTHVHILTNSSRRHAVEVLDRPGIADSIARIFSVEDSGYHLKPEAEVGVSPAMQPGSREWCRRAREACWCFLRPS
jgi:FMN phosphatase YigB (HAD superfamily)